mmetsp:Transcript_21527/g.27157  ORF Transcript_21527/g.27157 Transcript_21527/m.27157 type:complete len:181 (-) Transcript_21527:22-564(-)|eukprot:CAMPEP_0203673056 /NCGR_PEP_ID=MMETSP0090-20130426/10762_1 /ASSEMBLY_ACC=CAM_ASM_001088 /TAXON_ID=426623 /ORGANISM="Chaetoceros affinis, Strain CCMP159" /LENGTH=180 /DNA_ID=CAMNT_0050538591 /DNA_START=61 /DNA_END=603 /DNA_ORIENTATION=+
MGELPLHEAVKENDVAKVKKILANGTCTTNTTTVGVDINAEDDNGITALIEACISGNAEIVQILLEGGCVAQPAAGFKHSPLRGATVCGHSHLIPILLENGADPNALSDGNRTPLMGACFLRNGVPPECSALCVKELLSDERTDPTLVNTFGESALDLAKARGYKDSVVMIEEALARRNE